MQCAVGGLASRGVILRGVYAVTALLSVSERWVQDTYVQSNRSLAKERGLCDRY